MISASRYEEIAALAIPRRVSSIMTIFGRRCPLTNLAAALREKYSIDELETLARGVNRFVRVWIRNHIPTTFIEILPGEIIRHHLLEILVGSKRTGRLCCQGVEEMMRWKAMFPFLEPYIAQVAYEYRDALVEMITLNREMGMKKVVKNDLLEELDRCIHTFKLSTFHFFTRSVQKEFAVFASLDRTYQRLHREEKIRLVTRILDISILVGVRIFDREEQHYHIFVKIARFLPVEEKRRLLLSLTRAGYNINALDRQYDSPLKKALKLQDFETASLLIEFGARLKVGDFYRSIYSRNLEEVEFLVQHRTPIHLAEGEEDGYDPLLWAFFYYHGTDQNKDLVEKILHALLNHPDIHLTRPNIENYIRTAREKGIQSIVTRLEAKMRELPQDDP